MTQDYFSEKFKHFNKQNKLITYNSDDFVVTALEVNDEKIPKSKFWSYAFSNTFLYALLTFVILTLVNFLIGIIFFSIRKKVLNVIKKNDLNGIKSFVNKTRIKYIIFFIINTLLLIVFLMEFAGFGAAYGGAYIDYISAGIISLLFFEILPFLWSFILAIFSYIGIKNGNKCCYECTQFFLF